MWTQLCALVFLSAACYGNPINKFQFRNFAEDIEFAKYSTKKVSYDLDVLEARTNILALELQYTVFDLVLDIEKVLYELLVPADAERVVAEINKTADSVLTNVVRLSDIILRLDSAIAIVDNDLHFDVDAVEGDLLLLESYITNFNLTYDIGKENIILATNLIILTLQNELEDLNGPEVEIVFDLGEKIKVVLLAEQDYLDNARSSFDKNAIILLDALRTVVGNLDWTTTPEWTSISWTTPGGNVSRLASKTTTPITWLPPTSTTAASTISFVPTTPPTTTMSLIPTTPPTTTMSIIPITSSTPTPTLITDRTSSTTEFVTTERFTTSTPFFTTDRTTTGTMSTFTETRTLHTITTPTPTPSIYSN